MDVLNNVESSSAPKGQKNYIKDPNWLRENIDNEEALL